MNTRKETEEETGAFDKRRRLPIEIHIGSVLLAVMTIILFIQVVARFIFSSSFSWSEEVSRYLFIWMVFLVIGALIQLSEHIAIDVLADRVPKRFRRLLDQTLILIMVAINIILLIEAAKITWIVMDLGQISPAAGLPFWIVYAAFPVGLLIAVVRATITSIRLWSRTRPTTEETPA